MEAQTQIASGAMDQKAHGSDWIRKNKKNLTLHLFSQESFAN